MNEENRFEFKIEFENEEEKRKFSLMIKLLVMTICVGAFALIIIGKMLF